MLSSPMPFYVPFWHPLDEQEHQATLKTVLCLVLFIIAKFVCTLLLRVSASDLFENKAAPLPEALLSLCNKSIFFFFPSQEKACGHFIFI